MERIEQRMRTYSQEIQELKKIKKKDVRLLKFEDLSNLLSEESRKLKMLNDKLQDFVNLKLKEVQELESSSSDSFISQNNGISSLQQEWSSVLNDLKSEMTKWESLYMEIKSYGEKI
ncbi:AMOT [Lepeophtheirus salmonis]|uniref:AMOT n=1 Tax=Lepeophtheirus salmonis TaxID=72036 RepID=A0A7R8D683_LEPSM|nr:AMOT [Lepeophtheirus salmonis]CAF3041122.1 AMOT [Lepeophtheirus salmonis]